MCFDVENKCIRKKFRECHTIDFFYQEHKRKNNLRVFLDVIFMNISNANLFDLFYK